GLNRLGYDGVWLRSIRGGSGGPSRYATRAELENVTAKRDHQHFIHRLHWMEAHRRPNFLREVIDVARIPERNDHVADLVSMSRDGFLLESANRQHTTAKRNLAGHRNVAANRNAGERADHAGCNCNSG